jgi:hypothetical protein
MSKDLEKEYKALVNSEAPDLWARIENGIEKRSKKRFRINKRLLAGAVAACLCVAVIVPVVVRNLGGASMQSITSDSAAVATVSNSTDGVSSMDSASTAGAVAEVAEETADDAGAGGYLPYTVEEILGWFDGSGEPAVVSDAEPIWSDDGEVYYLPVADERMYDLRAFLEQYFESDRVDELLNAKIGGYEPFKEVDGVLYRGMGLIIGD